MVRPPTNAGPPARDIESERAANVYTPLGCVALATTRAIDETNEFDLLTKE